MFRWILWMSFDYKINCFNCKWLNGMQFSRNILKWIKEKGNWEQKNVLSSLFFRFPFTCKWIFFFFLHNCNFMLCRSFQVSAQMECKRHFSQSKPIEMLKGRKNSENYVDFYRKRKRNRWMKIGCHILSNNNISNSERKKNSNNSNVCSTFRVSAADKSYAQRQQKANSFTFHNADDDDDGCVWNIFR